MRGNVTIPAWLKALLSSEPQTWRVLSGESHFSFGSENSSLCPQILRNCIRNAFYTRKKITRSCKYGMGLGLIVTLNVSLGCLCHSWAKRASDVLWAVRCSSLVSTFLSFSCHILSKGFDGSKSSAVSEVPLGVNTVYKSPEVSGDDALCGKPIII